MRLRNGFTLIELGVILAVIAVGMAYVAPDFVEMARGQLATRAAKEMSNIGNAGKWFYLNVARPAPHGPVNRTLMRWPGEAGQSCNPMVAPNTPQEQLVAADYVENGDFVNPWGQPYVLGLELPAASDPLHSCKLVVSTVVPASVSREIKTYLPMAVCDSTDGGGACPGGAAAPNDVCCMKLVRPGEEAILQEWTDPVHMCGVMMGGEIDPATGKCDVRGEWNLTVCHVVKDANCRDGYVAVGNYRLGCGKYCEETWVRCCRGEDP